MKIIVICTGNTCRSQIAEGLLKHKYPEYQIFSAGTHPELEVNPYAVRAMSEEGYDISCLLYTSPSPRDRQKTRMPSSA